MKKTKLLFKAAALSAAAALMLSLAPLGVKAALVTGYSENRAPIAENLSVKTYRRTAVSAPLRAVDPDGELLSFSLSQKPRKGTVSLSAGSFTYTPFDGSNGSDSFSYTARDKSGAVSREAIVSPFVLSRQSSLR